jgi:hypothetical protein
MDRKKKRKKEDDGLTVGRGPQTYSCVLCILRQLEQANINSETQTCSQGQGLYQVAVVSSSNHDLPMRVA